MGQLRGAYRTAALSSKRDIVNLLLAFLIIVFVVVERLAAALPAAVSASLLIRDLLTCDPGIKACASTSA